MSSPPQAYSLQGKLYLLGIDLDNERVPDRKKLGYVLRAAALINLGLRGNVADVDGKVQVTNDEGIGDSVLNLVLGVIAMGRDRKWKHWVRHNDRDTLNSVENQLMSAGRSRCTSARYWRTRSMPSIRPPSASSDSGS
jgi:hypothetical protein